MHHYFPHMNKIWGQINSILPKTVHHSYETPTSWLSQQRQYCTLSLGGHNGTGVQASHKLATLKITNWRNYLAPAPGSVRQMVAVVLASHNLQH